MLTSLLYETAFVAKLLKSEQFLIFLRLYRIVNLSSVFLKTTSTICHINTLLTLLPLNTPQTIKESVGYKPPEALFAHAFDLNE